MKVFFRRLPHGHGMPPPRRASAGSSGFDVCAAVAEPLVLRPGERRLIPTGFAIEVPSGWEVQVRPRSGLALRHGLTVLNAPGTIDSDYRGEVKVLLVHLGQEAHTVRHGDRIAQLVVARVADAEWEEVEELQATGRGEGGFGSTG